MLSKNKLTPEKYFLALSAIIIVTFGSLIFIHLSNDHKECGHETKLITDSAVKITKTEKDICKEKYNF